MKLSGMEISAVVESYCEQEEKKLKPINDRLLAEAKTRTSKKVNEYMKIYKTIPDELKEIMYNQRNLTDSILASRISKEVSLKEVNRQAIRNKVIVMSIDCKTGAELAKKLGLKF